MTYDYIEKKDEGKPMLGRKNCHDPRKFDIGRYIGNCISSNVSYKSFLMRSMQSFKVFICTKKHSPTILPCLMQSSHSHWKQASAGH